MRVSNLAPNEYLEYFGRYLKQVPDVDLRTALDESEAALLGVLASLPADKEDYAYAPGKWTVKETLQHIIDTERIFSVRALRVARNDQTALPSYDHNEFVSVADVSGRTVAAMLTEFKLVRQSTKALFTSLTERDLLRAGHVGGGTASARALGFIIAGHAIHHASTYRSAYGL